MAEHGRKAELDRLLHGHAYHLYALSHMVCSCTVIFKYDIFIMILSCIAAVHIKHNNNSAMFSFRIIIQQGSRQSDIPWRCTPFQVLTAPFRNRKRHASKCQQPQLLPDAVLARHKSFRKTVVMDTWHAFIRKLFCGTTHTRMASIRRIILPNRQRKLMAKMMDEFGGVQPPPPPPPPLPSQSGYNPVQ